MKIAWDFVPVIFFAGVAVGLLIAAVMILFDTKKRDKK